MSATDSSLHFSFFELLFIDFHKTKRYEKSENKCNCGTVPAHPWGTWSFVKHTFRNSFWSDNEESWNVVWQSSQISKFGKTHLFDKGFFNSFDFFDFFFHHFMAIFLSNLLGVGLKEPADNKSAALIATQKRTFTDIFRHWWIDLIVNIFIGLDIP
jgi:hypothetical protein